MAYGRKTGGKDFVPGDPRIQRGKGPIPLKKLTQEEFITRFEKYSYKTVDELKELRKDGSLEALDAVFVAAYLKTITTGDYRFLQECVDRIIGKAKQSIDIKGMFAGPQAKLSPEEEARYEAELKAVVEQPKMLDQSNKMEKMMFDSVTKIAMRDTEENQ